MKVLCIHGIGNQDAKTGWQDEWKHETDIGIRTWNPAARPDFHFSKYDDLFAAAPLNVGTVVESLAKLAASGLFHGIVDMFRSSRGFGDTLDDVRWTAGMVAQWTANEKLRKQARARIAKDVVDFRPDIILAHSLGTLVLYDLLRLDESAGGKLARGCNVVTFGSQIGNPAVRQVFGGRIEGLRGCRWWWNLYNEEDDVFTTPLVPASRERFQQVNTRFDIEGIADHDGAHYLAHDTTSLSVWKSLAGGARSLAADATPTARTRAAAAAPKSERLPQKRALLVGIANYPDPKDALGGPVNDVFLMSSVLQELDFAPDSIRVVLNERATTEAIRERLGWLLEDAKAGDQLFFYFAGHGTQIPTYARDAEVDRIDECLVPYDFDWKNNNAITDDEFAELYSQLPYDVEFIAVLDCCHSGGMARSAGSGVRGLTPPDDIRHRAIRWDRKKQMWVPRRDLDPDPPKPKKSPRLKQREGESAAAAWVGKSGSLRRLGRGSGLWKDNSKDFDRAKKEYGHWGPYTPILFEACRESELAYEYHHGVTVHGAFTFSLCQELRDAIRLPRRTPLTFDALNKAVEARIDEVVTKPQTPQLLCPKSRRNDAIPGLGKAGRK